MNVILLILGLLGFVGVITAVVIVKRKKSSPKPPPIVIPPGWTQTQGDKIKQMLLDKPLFRCPNLYPAMVNNLVNIIVKNYTFDMAYEMLSSGNLTDQDIINLSAGITVECLIEQYTQNNPNVSANCAKCIVNKALSNKNGSVVDTLKLLHSSSNELQSIIDYCTTQKCDGTPAVDPVKPANCPVCPTLSCPDPPPFDASKCPVFDSSKCPAFDPSKCPPFDASKCPAFDSSKCPPFDPSKCPACPAPKDCSKPPDSNDCPKCTVFDKVNGGWSDWADSSPCISDTGCGGGKKWQVRTCTNPIPANGGALCSGDFKQQVDCPTGISCKAATWSDWTPNPIFPCVVMPDGTTKQGMMRVCNPGVGINNQICAADSDGIKSSKLADCTLSTKFDCGGQTCATGKEFPSGFGNYYKIESDGSACWYDNKRQPVRDANGNNFCFYTPPKLVNTGTCGGQTCGPDETPYYNGSYVKRDGCVNTANGRVCASYCIMNPDRTVFNNSCYNTPTVEGTKVDGGWSNEWKTVLGPIYDKNICGNIYYEQKTCTNPLPANGGAYCQLTSDCVPEYSINGAVCTRKQPSIANDDCKISQVVGDWKATSNWSSAYSNLTMTVSQNPKYNTYIDVNIFSNGVPVVSASGPYPNIEMSKPNQYLAIMPTILNTYILSNSKISTLLFTYSTYSIADRNIQIFSEDGFGIGTPFNITFKRP